MARKRTIVLMKPAPGAPATGGGGMEPMGTFGEVAATVANFNVSPDGSGPKGYGSALGMLVLFGPGFVLEIPGDGSPKAEVAQILATVTDEDFAWPVLSRMCKANGWRMMDPDTGRSFG